ncbi:hypothetical protein [Clostridium sp. ZS2-4]|uniref:hypothetical protein n=1 Tax=Clostridium sp. ZS2-4 TaxID=2987703 RepID=UPI00227A4099|nr:hypothetical protein [Clostridium sp. ZS2-4]MCY6354648.1 hypothetical protein [Clostridium sp. ZS2-4]
MSKIALMLLCSMVAPSAGMGNTTGNITNTKVEAKVDKEVNKPSHSEKDKLAPVEIEGKIAKVTESKGGIMALVQGKGVNSEVKLLIDNKTEIVNEKGEKLSIKDLKEGIKVKGYYGPAVTFSLPPMSVSQKIVVMEEKLENIEIQGKIAEITESKGGIMAFVQGKGVNSEVNLVIDNKTEIVNQKGEKLSIKDLKKGTAVKAFYGPIVTASLPPVSTAQKIVVMDKKELLPIQGSILDIKVNEESHMIHIKSKKSDKAGLNEIILNVNKDTKIVTVSGKELSINDLKEGTEVRAYYGPKLTRSLPPIGTAEKVFVFENKTIK